MQRNAGRMADRKYMETLRKSGIDFDRLHQSSLEGSRAANSVADNASDYSHNEEPVRSAAASPGQSSSGERSPDRESAERGSLSDRSRPVASGSPSAPEYTQEFDDYDGSSVIEEESETEVA